jgi:hypothetical protein
VHKRYEEGGGLLLNYSELSEAVCSTLRDHFGIRHSEDEVCRMREMPDLRLETVPTEAGGEVRELSARWIDSFYHRLETTRRLRFGFGYRPPIGL